MFLTKRKKDKLSKNLSTLGGASWVNNDIKVTKAICEICVVCNLNVDKVFADIESKSNFKSVAEQTTTVQKRTSKKSKESEDKK